MKYHTFEMFLRNKGLRCINYIDRGFDTYVIGRYYWGDEQILEDGLSFQFLCNENDFERYKDMLTWASDYESLK